MAQPQRKPITDDTVWQSSDFSSLQEITFSLGAHHIAALEEAYDRVVAGGLDLNSVARADFPLTPIADDLAALYRQVMHGRGIVILDRLPVEEWPQEKREIIYWGLGTHFGQGQAQSVMGDRLGQVINIGGKDPKERAYRNSLPLTLHTDNCDVLAMISLNKAKEGGRSQYASTLAIYNIMLEECPDLLAPLCEGFHYHRFGEHEPGESPVTEHLVPVFSETEGVISTRYVAGYIYMAYEELGQPLTAAQSEALEAFDDIARRPEVMLDFMQEPGQVLLCRNLTTLHARSGFEDGEAPEEKRHLMRLWLTAHADDARPVDPLLTRYRRPLDAKPRESTYYQGDATRALTPGILKY